MAAALPAPAAAADTGVVTGPEDGSAHRVGYTGPVSVDFTGISTMGAYTVSVAGPNGYAWQATWNFDGSQMTNTWSFDPVPARGTYTVAVLAPNSSPVGGAAFRVDDVNVTASSVSSETFFPLERDHHKDFAHFFFRTDARARDVVRVTNHRGRVIRTVALGSLSANRTHEWKWDGRNAAGRKAPPGSYTIRVSAVHGVAQARGVPHAVRLVALPVRITRHRVRPASFSPRVHDGVGDTTTFSFRTSVRAVDTIQIVNRHGRRVRTVRLGNLTGHNAHHWVWDGHDGRGRLVRAGWFRIRVAARHFDRRVRSSWVAVRVQPEPSGGGGGGGGGGDNCTPGYSPCLVYHGGADYDCYGGSGDGPYKTAPGVVYRVTGSDPYGLDGDNDGFGCEQ
jgi:flagellar hook assembly protein FlgD